MSLTPLHKVAWTRTTLLAPALASPELRKQLLETCDVLEIWELQSGVFEATARTVVIFAQKKIETRSHSNNPVRIRSIQSKTLEDFKKIGVFTASSMLNNQVVWGETARKSKGSQNTYIMDYRVVLPDYAWHIISHCIERDRKPEITLDAQPDLAKANWFISGVVDSVNAEEGTITLWMEGFHELQKVQIVPSMPGWMLRADAAFRTKIPDKYVDEGRIDTMAVDWGMFRPQPYMYMSEEELFEKLADIFREDTSNRV